MDLHGQRVVVLGGTSGIGFATAKAAAGCGAQVTVVSSRPASVDRALADGPPGTHGRAADLTDPGQVRRLFGDLGGIDHLRERRRLGTLVTDDASFEDLMLHSATMGREAITAFLSRALPHLPYGGTGVTVRHTVGGEQGGGYEWTAPARPCRREP